MQDVLTKKQKVRTKKNAAVMLATTPVFFLYGGGAPTVRFHLIRLIHQVVHAVLR